MLTIEHVWDRQEQLAGAIVQYLEGRGWMYTSDTPGCVWLWSKRWNQRTIMVDQQTALRMESDKADDRAGRAEG